MRAKLARILLAAVVLAALGAPAFAQDRNAVSLTDIRQETTDRSTRITVECSGPLAYTYYSPDPLTLVVDIPEMAAGSVPSRIAVGSREVESLRVTQMARADGRSLTRLEVRLASLVPYQIYSKDKSLNLVFERPAQIATAAAPASAPVAPAKAPEPGPVVEAEVVPPPAASAVVEAPQPEAEPVQAASGPATRILGVTQTSEDGNLAITVKADGALHYQDFFLGNPDRLVVDFKDVTSRAPMKQMDVAQGPVRKVRLAQFSAASPKVARLVLDLSSRAPYRVVEGTDGVKIVFGEGHAPSPAPLAALRAEAASAPAPAPRRRSSWLRSPR
jgi:hypothetical protein